MEKEELISYANALLAGANSRLQTGNIAGACWRIADALGALSFAAEPDTGGIDRFTGLGFRLFKVNEAGQRAAPMKVTLEDDGESI